MDINEAISEATKNCGGDVKIITFTVPCYNSAEYMGRCIQSLIDGTQGHHDKVEILVVDDGSTKDNTFEVADAWQEKYPGLIRAIHQENAGHGGAVNKGLDCAKGLYFKVVDSDDWLDPDSLLVTIELLETFSRSSDPVDMVLTNYVYENMERGREVMDFKGLLPEGRVFGWDEVKKFPVSRYMIMHTVIYRTALLKDSGIRLPEHTFYVDNIFVYVPLPHVKTLFYIDLDLYHYLIGREDQSVNEKVMISRIDQQLRITRIMIDSHDLAYEVKNPKLRNYMVNYLLMMLVICSVFAILSDRKDRFELRDGIWNYLRDHNPGIYPVLRHKAMGIGCNFKGRAGECVITFLYRIARRIWKFN